MDTNWFTLYLYADPAQSSLFATSASLSRVREAEAETRKAAAVERGKVARAAVEEARRRQDYDEKTLRGATEGKVAELEARAESFRRRRKVYKG